MRADKAVGHGAGCAGVGFVLIFMTFWTGLTGFFNVHIGTNIYRQMQAEAYPTTTGVVTGSEVEETYSDGPSYKPIITFSYAVNGVDYVGSEHRYGMFGSSDRSDATDVVARFPVDASVTVHYNPDDPADAVLETGVQGMDLFLVLFMTPFNIINVGGWGFILFGFLGKLRPRPHGGVRLRREPHGWRARLPAAGPLVVGIVTAFVASFISIFIVAFGFGFAPPMLVIQIVWTVIICLGVGAAAWRAAILRGGQYDVVVDEANGRLRLPAAAIDVTPGHGFDATLLEIDVERIERIKPKRFRKGRGDNKTEKWGATVHWTDGDGIARATQFADFGAREDLEAFLRWLRERLGLDVALSGDSAPT